ncbi:helix-turn-helix domain-containing protein [Candidatus Vondammii sp. HM_W22]|uniref:helix-turn-helix domain-containing protein n=1 Tax=Candidatus Vondammii sp. HM_W22 TaxID=2687299 RepID=UPI002E7B94B1|nr:helix-turn-helix transcriptional regulator [Candidatus Vondammii sp. HM_W22]
MSFPRKRRNWKRVRPSNLRDAFRLCKEYAREKKNLSVERIADLMGVSVDSLYKWLSNGKMPASMIQGYEHFCGIHLVSDYLASSANRLVIDIPTGRAVSAMETNELQAVFSDAFGMLIRYYNGEADQQVTEDNLTCILAGLVWHRENVRKTEQPELEFGVKE